MRTRIMLLALFSLFTVDVANASLCSRTLTFSDGSVLTAAQLNAEFNNAVNCVNSITNANIADGAGIDPAKISATIDGAGIIRNGTTGALSVNPDGSTIDISGDAVEVKAHGVGAAQIVQVSGLSVFGNATNATANVGEITSSVDGSVLRQSGTALGFGTVATAGIADAAVTNAKRGSANSTSALSDSGAFSSTSGSFVDVSNQSITITISTGHNVMLWAQSNDTTEGYVQCANCIFRYIRGATGLNAISLNNSGRGSQLMYVDTAGVAGTYTYKLQTLVYSGSVQAQKIKLFAMEL